MTSPIKPPGGKPPIDPAAAADGPKEGSADKAEGFREALGATETGDASATAVDGPTADVVADLRAGRIDAQTAVDRLVAQALESPMARLLDDAGRVQLEEHIRTTLAEDPNLAALVKDLGSQEIGST